MQKRFGLDRREEVVVSTTSLLPILLRLHERRLQGRRALQYTSVPVMQCSVLHDAEPPNNFNGEYKISDYAPLWSGPLSYLGFTVALKKALQTLAMTKCESLPSRICHRKYTTSTFLCPDIFTTAARVHHFLCCNVHHSSIFCSCIQLLHLCSRCTVKISTRLEPWIGIGSFHLLHRLPQTSRRHVCVLQLRHSNRQARKGYTS